MAGPPLLSVVVATRNRAASLLPALQTIDATRDEVGIPTECIVVDNGSSDTTAQIIRAWAHDHADRIVLTEERPGKARALNRALEIAAGKILAFTDDDVEVPPLWLRTLYTFLELHPELAAAVGRVETPPRLKDAAVLARVAFYRTLPLLDLGPTVHDTHHLYGCNMAIRRDAFARVGGFDERLGPGASGLHEDGDMAQRILGAGLRIAYVPDATVYHIVEADRLTDAYFRELHRRDAQSRFVQLGRPRKTQAIARLAGAALTCAWWSLARNRTRAMRARGRLISHTEMVRLCWAAETRGIGRE